MSKQPAGPTPVRRVGSTTLGLAMIAAGILLTCRLFGWLDSRAFFAVCRLSPLLLVGVGVEVCLAARAGGDDARLRLDWLGALACGALLCLTLGLAALALLLESGLASVG